MEISIRKFVGHALTEFGPIITFIILYEKSNFFIATIGMMCVTVLLLVNSYVRERYIPAFPIIVGVFTLIFGLSTIFFHNKQILIFRDTLYDLFFAGLIAYGYFKNEFILQKLFGRILDFTKRGWQIVSITWFIYFISTALANEYIRHFATPRTWVHFKIFVILLTISVALVLFKTTSKYIIKKK